MSVIDEIRNRLSVLAPERIELIDDSHLHAGHAGARSGGGHKRKNPVALTLSGRKSRVCVNQPDRLSTRSRKSI